jgi:4-amino-4-deoxy-L-arabinose transferase-like glycosyltransferase
MGRRQSGHGNSARRQVRGTGPPIAAERDGDASIAFVASTGPWLLLLTFTAAVLHLLVQSGRPLWLDEACTRWTIHASAAEIVRGIRTDGTPPIFFLLESVAVGVFGASELGLRAVSICAATLLVPACYAIGKLSGSRLTALMAAFCAAFSPLVHYYAVEARPYALVQLETAAVILVALRAVSQPSRGRWWLLLAATQAVELWTHTQAVFLVATLPVALVLSTRDGKRQVAVGAISATALALVLALPPLLEGVRQSGTGVADWIARYWLLTPPWAAILRSLEAFGFGGVFPRYLSSLSQPPTAPLLPAVLTSILMVVAAVSALQQYRSRQSGSLFGTALFAFLFLPLLTTLAYSFLRQPLYLVGRYDTIVLPVFLVLVATGLEGLARLNKFLAAGAVVVILGLSMTWSISAAQATTFPNLDDKRAAEHIAKEAGPSDSVVTTGYRRAVTAYYLEIAGRALPLFSFPSEVAEHPGWYSSERLLSDPASLARQGEQLAAELVSRAGRGGRIWVLSSGPSEVDDVLYRVLLPRFEEEPGRSREDCRVFCLRLR